MHPCYTIKTKYKPTCMSFAGFQSISNKIKREAPVKFKPTPPAFELSRNTTERSANNKKIGSPLLRPWTVI